MFDWSLQSDLQKYVNWAIRVRRVVFISVMGKHRKALSSDESSDSSDDVSTPSRSPTMALRRSPFCMRNLILVLQDINVSRKRKRSKTSPPPSRAHSKKIKNKSKKQIYDSESSSLSEGEIADEKPAKRHASKKQMAKKYDMSDDSTDSDDESDSNAKVQETTQSKYVLYSMRNTVVGSSSRSNAFEKSLFGIVTSNRARFRCFNAKPHGLCRYCSRYSTYGYALNLRHMLSKFLSRNYK